jgi:hypothetical protein
MVSSTRALLNEYDPTNGPNKGIFVTETDSAIYKDGQEGAVWGAASEADWLQSGAQNIDWWDLQNGIGTPDTDPSGTTDYEDGGILSSGTSSCSGSTCEPAADTPFRTYYGLGMMKYFVTPGDSLVSATSSSSDVQAFAATNSSGGQSVLLANTSETNAYDLTLSEGGRTVTSNATVYSYTPSSSGITSTTEAASSVVVPADSLVVVSLSGGAPTTTTTVAPTSTTTPVTTTTGATTTTAAPTTTTTATATTTTTAKATTTTTAATTTTAKATTTTTTTAATTTTTVAPSGSCNATYSILSQWTNGGSSGGFTANVTVTAGSSALSSWKVTWTYANGQTVTNAWNANATQSGSSVSATNESYNGSLAAGASTSFGFQGNWSGTNAVPTLTCS